MLIGVMVVIAISYTMEGKGSVHCCPRANIYTKSLSHLSSMY